MQVCSKCWNEETKCKCNGIKIEIDDSIADIIMILNKKGFSTDYCCGGHIVEKNILNGGIPDTYIMFSEAMNENYIDIGKDWRWSAGLRVVRFSMFKCKKPLEKAKDRKALCNKWEDILKEKRKELLEWAKNLPNKNSI